MRYFYLISVCFALLSVSCRLEPELPDVYEVRFLNQYFESLTSVEIADNKFQDVDIDEKIVINNVPRGEHTVTVRTQSGLIIEADASLTGTNPSVQIVLTEGGILQIR